MYHEGWSIRKYPSDKPSIILQGSDTDWSYDGVVALDHDLDIYAESLTLPAHLTSKGHHIGIYANSITVLDKAEIVVSGAPGADETNNAFPGVKSGGKGEDAGNIELYTENASLGVFKNLQLLSVGGKGGSGEDTSKEEIGGLGGDGGNAGQVTCAVRTWGFTATFMERATAVLRAKQVSEAQEYQILQDFVSYSNRLEHPQKDKPDHSSQILELKNALASNSAVDDLMNIFREAISTILSDESSAFESLIGSKVEYSGGAYGIGGRGTKGANKNGKAGKPVYPKILYCYLQSNKLLQLSMPIAHPDQCAMILHLARLDYYISSESSMKTAIERLTRVRDRLLFLDGLQASDPIYKAYEAAEVRLHILPPRRIGSTSSDLASIASLREVAADVDALLRQIAGGFDFYGHTAGWVPRGSREFYDKLTLDMLENAKTAEKAHEGYRKAEKDNTTKLAAVRNMRNQASVGAEAARDFAVRLRPVLEAALITIGSMDYHMKECKKELVTKIKDQSQAIRRVDEKLGANFSDIVEAATMVAFCPNLAMVLIQGAGLTYKAVKNANIENDDDEPGIKKELLIRKMSSLSKGTDALVQSYKASSADDGTIAIDDPAATKLITKKEDYMELVSNYSKALGEEKIEEVEKAFDTFVEAALDRNNQILTYNANVNLLIKKRREAIIMDAKAVELSDEVLAKTDPDLPAISIFMERSYSESLWLLLESLSMTQRALRFWSLSTVDEIKEALQDKPPSLLDAATLSFVRTRLLKSYGEAVERFGKEPQTFSGIRHHLSPAELRRWTHHPQKKTIVEIPPVFRGTTAEQSPFYSKCNVRLHCVRFFAEGVTTKTETLLVILTHLGEETIVDTNDKAHTWVHEQIKVQFQYRLADRAFNVPSTVDGKIGEQTTNKYAMVGPFASWLIDVNPLYNTDIEMNEVSDAWLEFDGVFDSL